MSKPKRIIAVFVAASLVAMCLVHTARAVVVTFEDSNLEAVVREYLNKPTGYITDTDMATLTDSLNAGGSNISNIQGMEYATNLTTLYLYHNDISNISALSGLTNLTYLHLHENDISDISALSGLTNLSYLEVGANNVSSISVLSGLTNLGFLNLHRNDISDISTLSGLTNLYFLELSSNDISDISVLSGLTKLSSLRLGSNHISDISALSKLTNLYSLNLANNQIEVLDLCGSNFPSFQYFRIEDNPITKVCLANATLRQSTFNALMNGGTSYYYGIAEVPGVSKLDLSGVDFSDISDFSLMFTMDDLEILLLRDVTNLDGSEVVAWTDELDSLNWLDVTGLWDSFDIGAKDSLLAWDAIDGNTLVVPEPATLSMLLILVAFLVIRRRQG